VKWYQKAAQRWQKHAEAQYNLGLAYHKGQGVRKDYGKAFEWWSLSKRTSKPRSENYDKASHSLDMLEKQMTSSQIASAKASI
jgi:TPR repeat protein